MSQTITRAELANSIYHEIGLSVAESNRIILAIFEEIVEALSNGEYVKISNFGSFYPKNKKERIGRNPKTLQEFKIPARKVVSFYPANSLKFRVNK